MKILASVSICIAIVGLAAGAGCRSPERKFAAFMDQGKRDLEKKDFGHAVIAFKNAAAVHPQDAEAQYQLAVACLGAQDFPNALAALKKATALNPSHTGAQLKLAELMTTSRQRAIVEDAEKRIAQVLAESPDDPEALSALAMAEWRLGRSQDAESHLAEAFAKAPQDLKAAFDLVRIKLAAKEFPAAEAILQKALSVNPKSTDAAFALAQFYVLTGRAVEAEQQFRGVLRLDPQNGPALVGLGGLLASIKRTAEAEELYRQASALPEARYKPIHAIYLFRSGRRDEAIRELEALAKQDPKDRDARTRLIAAYHDVGRPADAEKLWRDALAKNRKDIGALLERSRYYLGIGNLEKAETDLSLVLRLEAGSAEGHYLLSKIHERRNAPLRRRQELSEAVRLKPDFLTGRIELAGLLIAANAPSAALEVLNQAPEQQKNRLSTVIYRSWAQLLMGDKAAARQGVDSALATARTRNVLLLDATLRLQMNDPAGARKSAEAVLNQNPEDVAALDLLVQSHAAQNQAPAAIAAVRKVAASQPKSAPLQHYLGTSLLRTGDRNGARAAFRAAMAGDPWFLPAGLDLARLEIDAGNLTEARGALAPLLEHYPADVRCRMLMGGVEERQGKPAEALQQYRKALELDPQNITAMNNVAYLLVESNSDLDGALRLAQKAAEIAPNEPSVQDTLGWTLYHKGLYSKAVPPLESAAQKMPTAAVKFHLAAARIQVGDVVGGRRILAEAMKMDPALAESASVKRVLADVSR